MNLTGQFLISMPSLLDERFEKTVIYMCAHSQDGAMGIIINRGARARVLNLNLKTKQNLFTGSSSITLVHLSKANLA